MKVNFWTLFYQSVICAKKRAVFHQRVPLQENSFFNSSRRADALCMSHLKLGFLLLCLELLGSLISSEAPRPLCAFFLRQNCKLFRGLIMLRSHEPPRETLQRDALWRHVSIAKFDFGLVRSS